MLFWQMMSVLPSLLKSPVPTTLQSPNAPVEIYAQLVRTPAPSMYQTMICPMLFWQRMSVFPSLLKSPFPTTFQSPKGPVEM